MTRRSSVRAQAREIYQSLAAKETKANAAANPPSPDGFGGQGLTEKVRALYEGSAVPVAKIAAIAGVTERTIYKYVARQNWKRRYRVLPRGEAAARVNRGRSLQPTPDFAPDFTLSLAPDWAPVRGAGSRFIRRADKGRPFAQGLKATDPAGRQQAATACVEAERLSDAAQAKAKRVQRTEALIQAIDWTGYQIRQLTAYRAARAKQRNGQPKRQRPHGVPTIHDRIEDMFVKMVGIALSRWEALLAEEEHASVSPAPARIP
jgi:hypothetical protein